MSENDVAIIGMAAHFPGALDPSTYWSNLREGVESVRSIDEEQLIEAGVRRDVMRRPGYVRSAAVLDGVFDFDAEFFGLSPKEAAIMDPQHRHFLMTTWEAIEDAGHPPETFDGAIGVFAGSGMASYFAHNILSNRDLVREVGMFLLRHTGNDKDFLSTRASYLFDLTGPSINVQTACSTSLVATHLGVQHLLSGECDIALAGGVTIEIPHGRGYQYEEGEILSPDGHCRPFDHRSAGTVFGSGCGVVALRRLEDAVADGDRIYAVIKGTAVNNDGAQKVGYLAPSVDGQAACIAEALAVADVGADTVEYVECHGTGTPMGDPIEVAALSHAFRGSTDRTGYCRIGSVKSNIGHLDTAAGVASLIKVALSLQHREFPPSLNFERNNPSLALETSPFVVNSTLTEWTKALDTPRRAGVNSLGVGGTNAFAVLEEAPPRSWATGASDRWRLLTVTGRNRAALDANTARLATHLREHPDVDLADVAYTLQVGRRHFAERRVVAVCDREEAIALLESKDPRRVFTHTATIGERRLVFMFPGGGTQHPGMGADLYEVEPVFTRWVDEGLRILEQRHSLDLRSMLIPDDALAGTAHDLAAMGHQLPLIFIIEYAMSQLLIDRGIEPAAMIGHSLGENTAACVGGTISFEDALGLVVLRGKLMDRVPGGALSVSLPRDDLTGLLDELDLDLAVVNSPDLCVVSGAVDRLAALEERLRSDGVDTARIDVSTPVHGRLLEPVLAEFRAYLESIELRSPRTLWVSNRTGSWITPEQATDPEYWVAHLRGTVEFADCLATLAADPSLVLLEVGPGKSLSSLARSHPDLKTSTAAIPMMRHPDEAIDDNAAMQTALGRLWAVGGSLDVERSFDDGRRQRISLPTYAFQTKRFFIEPSTGRDDDAAEDETPGRDEEARWFWKPVWRSQDVDEPVSSALSWLVFADSEVIGREVVTRLRDRGDGVVVVRCGDSFQMISDDEYVIAPELGLPTYESLMKELVRVGRLPDRIAHLALVSDDERAFRPGSSFFHRNQELGFQSLVFLAQAWSSAGLQRPLHLAVATVGVQRVLDTDVPAWPEQSTVLGPTLVIPRELVDVTASAFDLDPADLEPPTRLRIAWDDFRAAAVAARAGSRWVGTGAGVHAPTRRETALDAIVSELLAPAANQLVAIRGDRRFVQDIRRIPAPDGGASRLRRGGVVVITGGLGGIGLTVAQALFHEVGARIALMSRSTMPPREIWDELLGRLGAEHPTAVRIAAVRSLEAQGAEVLLVHGDVTDIEQTRSSLGAVRERFGGIDAVVHAAGVVDDALMVAKLQADMEDVLAPKVYGTLVMEELTCDDDLDLFVVFSSTSTVTAPMGQVDYVAANAFLNAFATARRAAGHDHVIAVNWGVWSEIGMAAESVAPEGGNDEVLQSSRSAHPFFVERSTDRNGVVTLISDWSTDATWFLDDHRTATGDALMPGSGYLELARGALTEIGLDRPFEIRDLTFLRPLAAADGDRLVVRTVLSPTEEGYTFVVSERVLVSAPSAEDESATGQEGWRRSAEAKLLLYRQADLESVDIQECRKAATRRSNQRSRQHDHLCFGPRWDVMGEVRIGDGFAMAYLSLPEEFSGDVDEIGLHPALVDLGTGFAMDLIPGYTGDQLWVPVDYRRIRILGRLPGNVVSMVSIRPGGSESTGFASFDVQLCSTDGVVLVEVEAFTIKRLQGPLDVGTRRRVLRSELESDPANSGRHPSQSELAFRHNLAQGIRSEEGKRVFLKMLAPDVGPVVYASSLDLVALRQQTASIAAAQLRSVAVDTSAVFGRPDLDSEFVAPRNDIEENIVTMWQELLGISQIGVRDNFFDLGGHSLIAVRLFARVKRVFSVEFPISVLFEAPTIEACADLIAAAMPASDESGSQSTIATPRPRYRHLVPMHPGEGGPQPPFFLVAGMFGNVLNLRHLAHQIGTDRPFYGLQARGLYGEEAPHEDFLEMAEAYVDEVRLVQPNGPYSLGGFSGGGIVALEMARLLRSEGEEVALLVMLDTPIPINAELTTFEKVQMHLQRLRGDGIGYVKTWFVNRLEWQRQVRHRRRHGVVAPTDEGALHSTVIEAAFHRALERYEVRYYDGTITLYRPRLTTLHVFGPDRQIDPYRRFVYHDNGWGPYCEDVRVTEVPGDHDGMVLEPSVRVLASHIRSELQQLDEADGHPRPLERSAMTPGG